MPFPTVPPFTRMTPGEEFMLQLVLEHSGLSGLARCVSYMRPGEIEAKVNWALNRTNIEQDPRAYWRLHNAKMTARKIRKPINDFNEYMAPAEACLAS